MKGVDPEHLCNPPYIPYKRWRASDGKFHTCEGCGQLWRFHADSGTWRMIAREGA